MQKYNFKNKKILITGAANGLGYYLAIGLIKKGSTVIVIDKDYVKLNELKNKFNTKIDTYHYDLKDLENLEVILTEIDNKYEKIDCIINNAAYELAGFIDELELKDIVEQYNTNFFSGIGLIKKFIKKISLSKGKIVSLSSDAGFRGVPTRSIYCSSKAAIYYFAEALRLECDKYNVESVIILPPKLNSSFWEHIEYRGSIREKPLMDARTKYDTEKFANEVIDQLEKNKKIITKKFRTIKIFTFLNYLFPFISDFIVKKFTNINQIQRNKF